MTWLNTSRIPCFVINCCALTKPRRCTQANTTVDSRCLRTFNYTLSRRATHWIKRHRKYTVCDIRNIRASANTYQSQQYTATDGRLHWRSSIFLSAVPILHTCAIATFNAVLMCCCFMSAQYTSKTYGLSLSRFFNDMASSDLNPIHGQFKIIILNAIHRKCTFPCFTLCTAGCQFASRFYLTVSHHVVYTTL